MKRGLETLKSEGVQVDPHREDYDYGCFAWIMTPTETGLSCGSRSQKRNRDRKSLAASGRFMTGFH